MPQNCRNLQLFLGGNIDNFGNLASVKYLTNSTSGASKIRGQIYSTLQCITLKVFHFCISSCRIVCVKLIAGSGSEQESAPGFVTHSILAARRIQFISTNLWVTHDAFCRSSKLIAHFITWNIFWAIFIFCYNIELLNSNIRFVNHHPELEFVAAGLFSLTFSFIQKRKCDSLHSQSNLRIFCVNSCAKSDGVNVNT